MKIYSMTATFGKLEHETLALQPGLNIIEAPNEWGKSTWCAFLVNMLYGIDTKAKSTKTALADKERYAPWSGSPMSGRIDLQWNGRDITIERATKGRLIFGDFKAYETATGIEIPELNSANCGQLLLGVERPVFTRAGFLKLTDLPVTQDDALRRRLNSLVTTGDESGAGDALAKQLKDLKNKCRYNRSGLLPQAEAQRDQLDNQLAELENLQKQTALLHSRQAELETRIAELENHRKALHYAASQADATKVADALKAKNDAQAVYDGLSQSCDGLPSQAEAQQAVQTVQTLQQQWLSLQMEGQMLPPAPTAPAVPEHYTGLTPEEAVSTAKADVSALAQLDQKRKKRNGVITALLILAALSCAAGAALRFLFTMWEPLLYGGIVTLLASAASLIIGITGTSRYRRQVQILFDRHPKLSPDRWIPDAEEFAAKQLAFRKEQAAAQALRGDLDARLNALQQEIDRFTGGEALSACADRWNQILAAQSALGNALRDLRQAESHAAALQSMVKTVEAPTMPDALTCSEAETAAYLNSASFELKQLQLKLGQYQGRSEALGQEAALRTQLKAVNRRIQQLEDTYAALELAQRALSAATTELQRRFAPRISKRAQALFSQLTGGRYAQLTLSEDLSLNIRAEAEDTLRPSLWRSDGTVDQLYLALRLAVAEELTPDAPLILDDALVRFDDSRLATALDILRQAGQTKQVILFTCQGRETKL